MKRDLFRPVACVGGGRLRDTDRAKTAVTLSPLQGSLSLRRADRGLTPSAINFGPFGASKNRQVRLFFGLVLACLLLSMPSALARAAEPGDFAELKQIRDRLIENWTYGWAPKNSQEIAKKVARLDGGVDRILSAKGGYWAEWTRLSQPALTLNASAFWRPHRLALAYSTPASRHYHSPAVRTAIETGLKHLSQFVYPGCPQPGNWWAWQIGMPLNLTPTLMLTQGQLDQRLWDQEIATLRYLLKLELGVSPSSQPAGGRTQIGKASGHTRAVTVSAPSTDTNNLWHYALRLQFAVLIADPALAMGWGRLAAGEIRPAGQGHLQPDYSYKFHGAIPMWAYGREFINDYGLLIANYGGTAFGPDRGQIELYAEMLRHYVDGFLYRNRICPAIIGRELTRGDDETRNIFLLTAMATLAHRPEWQETFAPMLVREAGFTNDAKSMAAMPPTGRTSLQKPKTGEQEDENSAYRDSGRDAATAMLNARQITLPAAQPAAPVDDIFAYPDSDFLQITRPDWAIGIKMQSSRNRGYESINGENLQGWFLSHGSTFHYLCGDEWDGCWPTLDWTRLPGTTADRDMKGPSESAFAGVLRASSELAVAAVELRHKRFRARKSWLVDENTIVCLGSGIQGRAETTVFSQPVSAGAPLVIDSLPAPAESFDRKQVVHWFWLENMAYAFPKGQELRIVREQRTSNWSSIRDERLHGTTEPMQQEYLTAVIAHGAQNSGYAYLILPNVSRERAQPRVATAAAQYLFTNDDAHHVERRDGQFEAVVLWEPGSIGPLVADRGCIALRNSGKWHMADPAWTGQPLKVAVGGTSTTLQPQRGRPVELKP